MVEKLLNFNFKKKNMKKQRKNKKIEILLKKNPKYQNLFTYTKRSNCLKPNP